MAERLLDDDPPPAALVALVVEPDPPELGHDLGERRRLGREVVEVVALDALLGVDLLEVLREVVEGRGVGEVQSLVVDPRRQRPPRRFIERQHPRVLLERGTELVAELGVGVWPAADAQDGELVRQEVRPPQLVERRHDLAVGEVAGRAEQDQHAWIRHALEAKALAQRVGRLLLAAPAAGRPGLAQLAHRARRVLRSRGGVGRLVRRRFRGDERRGLVGLRGRRPGRAGRNPAASRRRGLGHGVSLTRS